MVQGATISTAKALFWPILGAVTMQVHGFVTTTAAYRDREDGPDGPSWSLEIIGGHGMIGRRAAWQSH